MGGDVKLMAELHEAAAAATAPIRVEGPGLMTIVAKLVKQSVIEVVQPKATRDKVVSQSPTIQI